MQRAKRPARLGPAIRNSVVGFFRLCGVFRVFGFRVVAQRQRNDNESPAELLVPAISAISQSTILRCSGYPALQVRRVQRAEFSNSETDRRLNAISYRAGFHRVLDVPPLSPPSNKDGRYISAARQTPKLGSWRNATVESSSTESLRVLQTAY